jgi:starch synthase
MRILMAAPECVPFAKTGGLADVVGALPVALAEMGHEVAVIMPRYQTVRLDSPTTLIPSMSVPMGGVLRFASLLEGPPLGKPGAAVRTFFVDHPPFYDRPTIYGPAGGEYWDNAGRFAFFCYAVMEAAKQVFRPDILHAHDWPAALLPVLKKSNYMYDWAWGPVKTVLTIHNIGYGYQGEFDKAAVPGVGLSWDLFRMDRLEHHDHVNFLKGGIVYSDAVTTVSPRYAEEIKTPPFGAGLDGVIRDHAGKLHGILNGVDYGEWDPERDKFLVENYGPDDLSGKRECKRDLLQSFELPSEDADLDRPLIGIVSRFATQKGFDLIAASAYDLVGRDLTLVALGTGEPAYERLFRDLHTAFPGRVAVRIGFSNELAHKIEAGADMFLMPSRYEPCGLNQMYSLKYGTPPIVRATGGLDDTVDAETGFKFVHHDGIGLMWAVGEALNAYHDRPRWEKMMQAGMARDHSWAASAREYEKVYLALR